MISLPKIFDEFRTKTGLLGLVPFVRRFDISADETVFFYW
jgi:hypothetical protein